MHALIRTFVVVLVFFAGSAALAAEAPSIGADVVLTRMSGADETLVILDVRTPAEYARGHVPGAINIPYDQIPTRVDELQNAKDKEVVLYCHSGGRADVAVRTLKARGFEKLRQLDGDWVKWRREDRPVER